MISFNAVRVVARHPTLWMTALGSAAALAPRRWWMRWPFLPIPDPDVVSWRVTTAYGHGEMALVPEDLILYLRWRRKAPL
ncbi:hypothetical protein MNBD_ACTINO01-1600 [hydrothermal vent metagenome]|uniref:Uncharacterized protein n=1 Tax=hydrothermal vent metagenome TaxID=652676 RepID=A0A3B0SMN1_9ZZZZ